jgi:hypothetical protein
MLAAVVATVLSGCAGSTARSGSFDVPIDVVKHGRQVIALVPVTIDGHGPSHAVLRLHHRG